MKQKDEVAKMKEINYKAISNKIRRKRVSMGLTQEYLATAADVNVSHISNIENCHSKVSLNTLVYICKAMNTTLDYVVSEEYSSDNESLDQQIILELKKCDTVLKEKILKIIVNLSYKYNKVSFRFTIHEIKNRLHKINVTYFLYCSIFLTLFIKHFVNCCNLSANN